MLHAVRCESRPWAAFFWGVVTLVASLVLTGCAWQSGTSPLVATLDDAFAEDVTATARRLPYASLQMTVSGNGGLWILASQMGDTTYWQSRDATIALHDGYLVRTAGLGTDLVDTRREDAERQRSSLAQAASSASGIVTRTWRTAQSGLTRQTARAILECAPSLQSVSLPLARIDLQRCEETLAWQSGEVTHGTLWRSPEDGRIWAMQTQPWPDAPVIEWKVARPWW